MAVVSSDDLSARFGALLYRLREAQGLSQNAAAKKLGISQPRLRDYELACDPHTGKPTLPPPATIRAIAKLYLYPEGRLLLQAGFLPKALEAEEADRLLSFMTLPAEQQMRLLESR
jgi:transcriptional regulator with XRE-family HTH domain